MSHLITNTQSTSTHHYQVTYDPAVYKEQRSRKIQWMFYAGIAFAGLLILAVNSLVRFDITMIFVTALLCVPMSAAGVLYAGVRRAFRAIRIKHDFVRETRRFVDDWMRSAITQVLNTNTSFEMKVSMTSEDPGVYLVDVVNTTDAMYKDMKFIVGPYSVVTIEGEDPRLVFYRLQRVFLGKDVDGTDAKTLGELFFRVNPQVDDELREVRSLHGDD